MDITNIVNDVARYYPIIDEIEINGIRLKYLLNFGDIYECVKRLGTGAFGTVYCYRELSTNNLYAFKEVIIDSKTNIEKLQQEVTVLRKLSHGNKSIVQYYDSFIYKQNESTVVYVIVTEYISGFTLHDYIERLITEHVTVPPNTIFNLSMWLFSTLAYIHEAGYVHRDIKPENIMIDEICNRFVLLDFGLTRPIKRKSVGGTKRIVGTPDFIPPERWDLSKPSKFSFLRGENLSTLKKSDVWSAGITIYFVVERRLPWDINIVQLNSHYDERLHLESLLELGKQITGSRKIKYKSSDNTIVKIMKMCLNRDPNLRSSPSSIVAYMKDSLYKTSSTISENNKIIIPQLRFNATIEFPDNFVKSPKYNLSPLSGSPPNRYTPPDSPRTVEPTSPKKKTSPRTDLLFSIMRRLQ